MLRSMRGFGVAAAVLLAAACGEVPSVPVSGSDAAVGDLGRPADAPVVDVAGDAVPTMDGPAVDSAAQDAPVTGDAPDASALRCNPLAITDDCLLPYPSDFLTRADPSSPTHLRVDLPVGVLQVPAGRRAIDVAPFNRADGAPTTAPILVHFGVLVAPAFLADYTHTAQSLDAASPIAVFDLGTGERVPFLSEMDANRRGGATDRAALIVRPLRPLAFGAHVVVAIRRTVRTPEGAGLPDSPGFVALRDGSPSIDPRIEAARPDYERTFTVLAAHGYARADLQLAFTYTVASRAHVLNPILTMRDEVMRRGGTDGGVPFTVDAVRESPSADVARIVEGTFTPPNWLDANNFVQYQADGTPAPQTPARSYPYTMLIPAQARTATAPLPMVIFGHGVFGSGRDYLTGGASATIGALAQQAGVVVVATDWIGLSTGDRDLIISRVVTDINNIGLVTDRLLQSLANNLSLEELALGALQADARVRFAGAPLLDPARVYYYGVSLGGIQGSSLVSVSPHISRAVVAVPGASWSNILPRSIVYAPIQTFVNTAYPDPLVQAEFIGLLQARFDHTDGANLTQLYGTPPVPGVSRTVLLQEGIGDCLVPNVTTDLLARAFGASALTPSTSAAYGLPTVTAPATTSVVAQYATPTSLARYTPPTDNTVPAMDNGVHSDTVTLPNVLHQVATFLETGRIEQYCTGICDPD